MIVIHGTERELNKFVWSTRHNIPIFLGWVQVEHKPVFIFDNSHKKILQTHWRDCLQVKQKISDVQLKRKIQWDVNIWYEHSEYHDIWHYECRYSRFAHTESTIKNNYLYHFHFYIHHPSFLSVKIQRETLEKIISFSHRLILLNGPMPIYAGFF